MAAKTRFLNSELSFKRIKEGDLQSLSAFSCGCPEIEISSMMKFDYAANMVISYPINAL